jgi:hypothetical protein
MVSMLISLNLQATAADPGPIESIMPAPASLGTGWTRDTDMLMESVESPPTPHGDSPEEQLARQLLGIGVPLFKGANMLGNANFSYSLEAKDSFTLLDTYVSRFKTETDAKNFWKKHIATRQGSSFGVGDESLHSQDGSSSELLYFRTKTFHVKIIVLGTAPPLKKLASLIDRNIRAPQK